MSGELHVLEPWLDKPGICEHLKCSRAWIQERMKEGMPHAVIAGRVKFRASDCERWLLEHGHLDLKGDAA